MSTLRDELAEKTKAKIIELFGPESALAQAMEDDDFLEKLAQLVAWIYGEIMLSQPRPEPRPEPRYPKPGPKYDKWEKPFTTYKWGDHIARTAGYEGIAPPSTADSPFVHKLWSAMSKYERR